jgi:hypothetical protein
VPRSCCRTLAGCRLSSSSVTSASRATCDPRCLTHASTRECHGACRFAIVAARGNPAGWDLECAPNTVRIPRPATCRRSE